MHRHTNLLNLNNSQIATLEKTDLTYSAYLSCSTSHGDHVVEVMHKVQRSVTPYCNSEYGNVKRIVSYEIHAIRVVQLLHFYFCFFIFRLLRIQISIDTLPFMVLIKTFFALCPSSTDFIRWSICHFAHRNLVFLLLRFMNCSA